MKLYDRKSGYSSCVYVSTNTQFVGIHRLILRNKLIFHLQPLNEVGCVSVFMQVGRTGMIELEGEIIVTNHQH